MLGKCAWITPDHPRAGGEHDFLRTQQTGSSPRWRGTHQVISAKLSPADRIIPALAGNTRTTLEFASDNETDHPRAGGEHYARDLPRNEGAHATSDHPRAGGEHALSSRRRRYVRPDHPRAGGEHGRLRTNPVSLLPTDHPRAGGEHKAGSMIQSYPEIARIIPALAGNTRVHTSASPFRHDPDHPRAGGEHWDLHRCRRPGLSRIIPALAGNTWTCGIIGRSADASGPDHPRAGGEH